MFWYEKEEMMRDFLEKKLDILVATTVIEVGIDVPKRKRDGDRERRAVWTISTPSVCVAG